MRSKLFNHLFLTSSQIENFAFNDNWKLRKEYKFRQFHAVKALRYRSIISRPQNIAISSPMLKNGPKGTLSPNRFLPISISITATIAPVKKLIKPATLVAGQPTARPMRKASFKSPPPLAFSPDRATIAKKMPATTKAVSKSVKRTENLDKPTTTKSNL